MQRTDGLWGCFDDLSAMRLRQPSSDPMSTRRVPGRSSAQHRETRAEAYQEVVNGGLDTAGAAKW